VLDPVGRVLVSVYSGRSIGLLVPDEVAGLVRCVCDHVPGATG
jgi:hypothetical protein